MGSRKAASFALATVLLLLLAVPVAAQQAGGLALAIILDTSGSMLTNDRNQVGVWAAKRLVTMLGDMEQVTVVIFSDQASVLAPLRNVGGASARAELFSSLDRLTYKGNSDIKGSLELAMKELANAPSTKTRLAVLISDGDADLPNLARDSPQMTAYLADTVKVAGEYKSRDWPLYCVATRRNLRPGPLPGQIAEAGGGQLFVVNDIPGLMEFFQVVASRQEAALYSPPELHFSFQARPVVAGDNLPVRAGLRVWGEPLLPGKDAVISRLVVTAVHSGGKVDTLELKDSGLVDDGDERGGDGIYSGKVKFPLEGSVKVSLQALGSFRGRPFDETAVLGDVAVQPPPSVQRDIMSYLRNQKNLGPMAAGALALVALALATSSVRRRAGQNVKATLKYWPEADGARPVTIDLGRLHKKEVIVATEDHANRDFSVPMLERPFGFTIRKFNKFTDIDFGSDSDVLGKEAYVVIGLHGTFLLFEEEPGRPEGIPRTRKQVFNEDRFTVRGYVFEFSSPEECARRRSTRIGGRKG